MVGVRYPTPECWKEVTQADYLAFWNGVDMQKVFVPDRIKNKKSEAKKEEMRYVYIVVVRLREAGLLDCHNQVSDLAIVLGQESCPLNGQYPPNTFTLKNGIVTSKKRNAKDAALKKLNPQLEDGETLLNNYVTSVLEKTVSFMDDLFQYSIHESRLFPVSIRFPTPRGWEYISSADFRVAFEDTGMDLNDQITSGKPKNERELRELGLSWLAIIKLQEWGHLDDYYRPSVPTEARVKARENCPLSKNFESENSSVPGNISISDDSMSISHMETCMDTSL